MRLPALLLGALLLGGGPAASQAPRGVTADSTALQIAREVVRKTQGDRSQVLASMTQPMINMLQQMGIREPDRAEVLVQEVVLPTLAEQYDELLDIQARSFAAILSVPDMQAISAFYDTHAGRNLVTNQPQLAQAKLTGMTQWLSSISPALQQKLAKAVKAHGWDQTPAAGPRP